MAFCLAVFHGMKVRAPSAPGKRHLLMSHCTQRITEVTGRGAVPSPGSYFRLLAKPKIDPLCTDSHQTARLYDCSATPLSCGCSASCSESTDQTQLHQVFYYSEKCQDLWSELGQKFRFVPFSSFVSSKKGNTPLNSEIRK